ncbi:hypothetical protein HU200_037998 [Digitaria exilis]|uniref:Uncharacterized protein n=1 Tax=Digitaria exilis TaxID=1010633 RepID=A0A835EIY1_9POAL|nr:hypothetical protein HU200_037998 [Digitaria exilis]
MEDSSAPVYSFLEANAGKAWHGTNHDNISLEWLTERAVPIYDHSSLQCHTRANERQCNYEPFFPGQRYVMNLYFVLMLVQPEYLLTTVVVVFLETEV